MKKTLQKIAFLGVPVLIWSVGAYAQSPMLIGKKADQCYPGAFCVYLNLPKQSGEPTERYNLILSPNFVVDKKPWSDSFNAYYPPGNNLMIEFDPPQTVQYAEVNLSGFSHRNNELKPYTDGNGQCSMQFPTASAQIFYVNVKYDSQSNTYSCSFT